MRVKQILLFMIVITDASVYGCDSKNYMDASTTDELVYKFVLGLQYTSSRNESDIAS
jgi:hypothetical protein